MDDAAIVRLYWDRNEQAIPATAEKYGSYCTAIARNILGSPEDAEECVNDAYMQAWNASAASPRRTPSPGSPPGPPRRRRRQAAYLPMNISATRMALEKVGQVLKSTVA